MVIVVELFRSFDALKNSRQVIDDAEVCLVKFLDELEAGKKTKKNSKKTGDDLFYSLCSYRIIKVID